MFKNYLKIAWRNLAKQKTLSFINISGMSVGIACFSLFMLYAIAEFSFDSFHKNAADIYIVLNSGEKTGAKGIGGSVYTPMPLGPAMKQDLPGVENYVRYIQPYGTFLKVNNQGRREDISFADPSFFKVLSFKFKYGNGEAALRDMHSVVLTEETAKRLFGKANAIGESVQIKVDNTFEPFLVSAIAENLPANSIFQFSMLASFDYFASTTQGKMTANVWGWNSCMTLVHLKPGGNLVDNSKLLAEFRAKHFSERDKHFCEGCGSPGHYTLEPLRDIHTNPAILGVRVASVDPKTIWILLSIAAGVLFIACINFTTLSIGRSAGRAKEVGVRKVIGGTKKTLIFQFLTESTLLALLSTLIGLLLANLALPFFNQMSGRELSFSFTQFPLLYVLIAGLVLIVGLVAGCYPALILSGFNAVEALKTKIKLGGSNFFTKSLVTLQFVLSVTLIISSVIIVRQLHFMRSRNPGFEKANVLDVKTLGVANTKRLYPLFVHELESHPEITGFTRSDNGLGENEGMNTTGFDYHQRPVIVAQYSIDPNYLPTMGMHLLAGRNFDKTIAADTGNAVIINAALMREMGWTLEKSTGRHLEGYADLGIKNPLVIGVVRDFNYQDLTHQVRPLIFHQFSSPMITPHHFYVRIRPGNPSKALETVRSAWKKIAPEYPLQYNFLDEDIDRFFKSEARLSNIIGWAGGIAIFLACLGLLGLSALAVVNRTKEIGIRKVMGASVSAIISLVSKDFLKLVLVAFLIATPITWWLMYKWLQGYVYRITIEWCVFGISCVVIIFVALLTVCFQAIKAAISNPVRSLRSE